MFLLCYCIRGDDDGIVVDRGVGRKVLRWTSLMCRPLSRIAWVPRQQLA